MHVLHLVAGTLLTGTLLIASPAPVAAQSVAPAQAGFSAERLQRVDQFVQCAMAQGEISLCVDVKALGSCCRADAGRRGQAAPRRPRQPFYSRVQESAGGSTPLGMRDIFFWPTEAQRARLVTLYTATEKGLTPRADPDSMSGAMLFSASVGLMGTAEAYARFAMMLANGGDDGADAWPATSGGF